MKERMEEELWMKKIKERLEDYSEPIPTSGWERLENELLASGMSAIKKKRITPSRWRMIAAAAVLLVAVSSVSLWLLQSRLGDDMRHIGTTPLAIIPDDLSERAAPVHTGKMEPDDRMRGNASEPGTPIQSLIAQHVEILSDKSQREESASYVTADEMTDSSQTEEPDEMQGEKINKTEISDNQKAEFRRPSKKDKLHMPIESKSSSRSRGWAVALAVGNTGGFSNALANDAPVMNFPSNDVNSGKLDLIATADGIVSIPPGQEVVFKDGLPYLLKRGRSIASIDHKQPLSFGISVRKNLAKRFSVETGLTYTYLASDVVFDDSSEKFSQKLHYLGIPVRANWNLVDKESFTMYVSAGGAIEKCISGKIGSDNKTVKPVQLSVMGAVGAQYNFSNRVGLYIEPGVSYFFDDGSDVQTIRKEKPCNFTLQAGIRLTY